MEELSQGQNILSSDVKNNIMNYSMFDQEIHGGLDLDIGPPNQDLLKSKNNIIKQLKRKIEAYEKNAQAQNQKLSDYDHLFVEYNSLSKNFSQIQSDLDMIRNENMQLKDIINTKNQTIIDFQGLFEASKSKFDLFNQTNTALKARIEELEAKLKTYPDIMKNKEDLNQRMNDYETKIEQMKEEYNTKEELYKVKLNNQEKITKSNLHSYEEEINDLKNEIIKLKNQLDNSKKKNDELFLSKKSNEEELNNKLIKFEKENEKLTKIIANLKTNINDNELLSKTENNERKNMIDKLKEEIKQITKELSEKEEQNNTLTDALNQANNAINQSETEIQTRNNTINELIEEKNQLIKQLNDNQNDFNEYKNSSQQEIEMLHQKMLAMEEERENLMNDNENNINEVNELKSQINQYVSQEKIRFEESKEADDKFSNLAKAFQIKEKEYSEEIIKLTKINQKLQNDNENLKAKYEKKINLLTLQNNEATLRVKKLINTCISLKDYAMNMERNMSNAQAGINLGQMNNSMFLPNMGGLNINSTFQGGKFTGAYQNTINEGNQNDKILNDEELNQTY